MMSISHSDLMPIRSERSDAGLSQFEIVIGISQDFCWFSCRDAAKFAIRPLLGIFAPATAFLFAHRLAL